MSLDALSAAADRLTEPETRPVRSWPSLNRPDQDEPPGDWHIWLIMCGRGWGKTHTGSGWLMTQAAATRGDYAAVAPTYRDARDIATEGPSGLLAAALPGEVTGYNRSLGEIRLVNNSRIFLLSADEPDRARGLNLSAVWADELAAWRYEETWTEGLMPALRIGERPRAVVTTTPKPRRLIRDLVARTDGSVHITRGSTFDNSNLSPIALTELRARYDGTRLGRQELYGELVEDVAGALWSAAMIDHGRVRDTPEQVTRTVVAVDPAITSGPDSDETGIIVACRDDRGDGYVLADHSMRGRPDEWARAAVRAYDEHQADAVVVEVNQGGEMVVATLRSVRPNLPIRTVHASKGKRLRAEPISAMYEQGRVHHVGGFDRLEDQMVTWTPDDPKSPDRLDALVWALTDLMEGGGADAYLRALAKMCDACGYPNLRRDIACQQCHKPLGD